MMDSKPILPEMFHPQRIWRMLDGRTEVRPYTRTARPVKYYFVDYGHARRYSADDTNPLEVPLLGGDKTVPEFKNDRVTPRNPFHTDIYYMGNLIRRDFLEVCGHVVRLLVLSERISRIARSTPTSSSLSR